VHCFRLLAPDGTLRHAAAAPLDGNTALVVLSPVPNYVALETMLRFVAADKSKFEDKSAILSSLQNQVDHLQGSCVSVNASLLWEVVSSENIVDVWTALLLEESVVVLSSEVSILVHVMEALKMLLYPFQWEFLFCPLLPEALMDFLDAPQPLFVGVSKSCTELTQHPRMTSSVVLDLDDDRVLLPEGLSLQFPSSLTVDILNNVSRAMSSGYYSCRGSISEAQLGSLRLGFLNALAQLSCNYRECYMQTQPKKSSVIKSFQAVRKDRSSSQRNLTRFIQFSNPMFGSFLERFCRSQVFEQFLLRQLELDSGNCRNPFDLFESLVNQNLVIQKGVISIL
jgi:hypothetical protein